MSVRVDVITLGGSYCAVFRRAGEPDELHVDEAGKPLRFATASLALRAGRKAASASDPGTIRAERGDGLLSAWRKDKAAAIVAERTRVFSGFDAGASDEEAGIIVSGSRIVAVERRKRR